jgi:hypothetical protein
MKQRLLVHPPARVLRSLAKLHQFQKDSLSQVPVGIAAEAVIDRLGMFAQGALQTPNISEGIVREGVTGAARLLPKLGNLGVRAPERLFTSLKFESSATAVATGEFQPTEPSAPRCRAGKPGKAEFAWPGWRQVGVEAGAAGADKEKMATEKQIAANRRNMLKSTRDPRPRPVGRSLVEMRSRMV